MSEDYVYRARAVKADSGEDKKVEITVPTAKIDTVVIHNSTTKGHQKRVIVDGKEVSNEWSEGGQWEKKDEKANINPDYKPNAIDRIPNCS